MNRKRKQNSCKNINKEFDVYDKKNKLYFSYNARLSFNVALFFFLIIIGSFFLLKAFTFEDAKIVNYSEQSNLDYNVYLKENTFYDNEYLPKDMIYVASLIDKIKIDFNYNFIIEEIVDLNFEYEILGKLIISDEKEENIYYEKVYNLSEKKVDSLINNTSKNINESIEIDYNEYNKIANSFKINYGINTKNSLIVYFNINKKAANDDNNNIFINNNINNMVINIPLSEKSVDINMDYKDINNESKVLDTDKVVVDNTIYLVVSIISIIVSLIFAVKAIRLISLITRKKDVYDDYINKILKEYDRLIVETTTSPIINDEDKNKIIKIEKFTELLDVRDNLKHPIMYYEVTKHQKCYFYINNVDKIYLTVVKRVDLEVLNEKK